MNHTFKPSRLYPTKCEHKVYQDNLCLRDQTDHTERATCEVCGNTGTCEFYCFDTEYLMCSDCLDKERGAAIARSGINLNAVKDSYNNHVAPNSQRLANLCASNAITLSNKVDQSIQVREDIHVAETISIHELKKRIDEDGSVADADKHITLAKAIMERHNKFAEVIQGARDSMNDALIRQRAEQDYWQNLRAKLSNEEREQIKLKDINYKPQAPPKGIPKAPSLKKWSLSDIRLLVMKHKAAVPNSTITSDLMKNVCEAQNIRPEEALQILKQAGM